MSYLKSYSVPKERGQYWRRILNLYKDCNSYGLDVVLAVLKDTDKRLNKKKYLRSVISPEDPRVAGPDDSDLFLMNLAIDFFEKFHPQIRQSYKYVMSADSKAKQDAGVTHRFTEDVTRMALASIGYHSSIYKDSRSLDQKAKDFWFHSGFAQFISGIRTIFFDHLITLLPPEDIPALSVGCSRGNWFSDEEPNTISWRMSRFSDLTNRDTRKVALFKLELALSSCTNSLIPLAELEAFKSLAVKTWGPNAPVKLEPLELITLIKYVSLSQIVVDLANNNPREIVSFELKEKRSSIFDRENLEPTFFIYNPSSRLLDTTIGEIVANVYLDFWDELIYSNTYESYKGSFQCDQCGEFIPRSFDAYGQKYCTVQCKKLAAKNRYKKKKELRGRAIS